MRSDQGFLNLQILLYLFINTDDAVRYYQGIVHNMRSVVFSVKDLNLTLGSIALFIMDE